MDEKELVERIRRALKAKKSKEEIIRTLQKRGYRLEYINLLIKEATAKKRILSMFLAGFFTISLILFFSALSFSYAFFLKAPEADKKNDLKNPLEGIEIGTGTDLMTGNTIKEDTDNTLEKEDNKEQGLKKEREDKEPTKKTEQEIEITPDFISYLLNELGAWNLKKNMITGEEPVIDFMIENESFTSIIEDKEIKTKKGKGKNPDIIFYSNKKTVISATKSEEPKEVFKKSYHKNNSRLELKKTKKELFMKGYLGLYNSLNS